MYQIDIYDGVNEDLDGLPREVFDEVLDYFDKYSNDPYKYSQRLYNQSGRDLSSCRKTYIFNAQYRIIIQIHNNTARIVSVVCVGERQDMNAYNTALQRINNNYANGAPASKSL